MIIGIFQQINPFDELQNSTIHNTSNHPELQNMGYDNQTNQVGSNYYYLLSQFCNNIEIFTDF